MTIFEIIFFLGIALLGWYWTDALRCKEIARAAGRRACEQVEAQFLDDTVEITSMRLRRTSQGRIALYREYRFEFTHNRDYRLRGEIAMLGRHVQRLVLEP